MGAALLIGTSATARAQSAAKPAAPQKHVSMSKHEATPARSAAAPADRRAKDALKDARHQSKRLMHGIKLTAAEKQRVKSIEKHYDGQYKALGKAIKDAEKSGRANDAQLQQVTQLRDRQRAELRGALTAAQRSQFDANLSAHR
jgi:hypothetical protein